MEGRKVAGAANGSTAGRKIFVGGLSAQTDTGSLRAHFAKYGHIEDVVAMVKDGRPRCFGFVTFATQASAAAAVSEAQKLGGRYVDVKLAVPGEDSQPQLPQKQQQKQSATSPQDNAPNRLFVGRLPQEASEQDLRELFAAYGIVTFAEVMVDRKTRRSRRFGFVTFASNEEGAKSVAAALKDTSKHLIRGQSVDTKPATEQFQSPASTPIAAAATPTWMQRPQQFQQQPHLVDQQQQQQQQRLVQMQQQYLMQQQQQAWSAGFGRFGGHGMDSPDLWGLRAAGGAHFNMYQDFSVPAPPPGMMQGLPVNSPLSSASPLSPACASLLLGSGKLESISTDVSSPDCSSSTSSSKEGDESKPFFLSPAATPVAPMKQRASFFGLGDTPIAPPPGLEGLTPVKPLALSFDTPMSSCTLGTPMKVTLRSDEEALDKSPSAQSITKELSMTME